MSDRFGKRGATLIEYALLIALIALVIIPATKELGNSISNNLLRSAEKFSEISSKDDS